MSGNPADAGARTMCDPARGELLYSTHCIPCHSAQRASLQTEVPRWQEISGLGWSDEDIAAVTRYLNTIYYHYPAPY